MNIEELNRRSRLSATDKRKIVAVVTDNPLASLTEVSERTGVSVSSVRTSLIYLGLTGERKAQIRKEIREAGKVAEVVRLIESGMTVARTAQQTGLRYEVVQDIKTEKGLTRGAGFVKPRKAKHGTAVEYGYWGCRCVVCTDANRERCYAVKADMQSPGRAAEIPHGTMTGYWNWECRCEPCCAVGSKVNRMRTWTDPAQVTRFMVEWTKEEDSVVAAGGSARSIAVRLGRTVGAVNGRRSLIRRGVVRV